VPTGQEILHKWGERPRRFHPRMEITSEGLVLGAGTILAKMVRDRRGASRVTLDDELRIMALLATAYEQPAEPYLLTKFRRACDLWNNGEKALAHIHLAHAGLPICNEERAFRLCVADEILESGVTPDALIQSQGFDPAPLTLLKYNPDQPRVPAGSGFESGRWTTGSGAGTTAQQAQATEVAAPVQVAQNVTCSAFIAENCKGTILREFLSEYLDVTVDQILEDAQAGVPAAKKAKKLLFDKRFRK
jgi:hypothetical protein